MLLTSFPSHEKCITNKFKFRLAEILRKSISTANSSSLEQKLPYHQFALCSTCDDGGFEKNAKLNSIHLLEH